VNKTKPTINHLSLE